LQIVAKNVASAWCVNVKLSRRLDKSNAHASHHGRRGRGNAMMVEGQILYARKKFEGSQPGTSLARLLKLADIPVPEIKTVKRSTARTNKILHPQCAPNTCKSAGAINTPIEPTNAILRRTRNT
jgi:hypothetical protein